MDKLDALVFELIIDYLPKGYVQDKQLVCRSWSELIKKKLADKLVRFRYDLMDHTLVWDDNLIKLGRFQYHSNDPDLSEDEEYDGDLSRISRFYAAESLIPILINDVPLIIETPWLYPMRVKCIGGAEEYEYYEDRDEYKFYLGDKSEIMNASPVLTQLKKLTYLIGNKVKRSRRFEDFERSDLFKGSNPNNIRIIKNTDRVKTEKWYHICHGQFPPKCDYTGIELRVPSTFDALFEYQNGMMMKIPLEGNVADMIESKICEWNNNRYQYKCLFRVYFCKIGDGKFYYSGFRNLNPFFTLRFKCEQILIHENHFSSKRNRDEYEEIKDDNYSHKLPKFQDECFLS